MNGFPMVDKKKTWLPSKIFFFKLGMKLPIHILEISIFSLNEDIIRVTKIMNNLVKDLKILSFKVNFQCLKLVESFQKKNFCEEYLIRRNFLKTLMFKVLYLLKMCLIFVSSVHNFGKSDDDII